MIPITLVGNRALIFDIEQVKKLRKIGITGVLSGTLPMASQQNVFLGLPLQLIREEVIWLVTHGEGYLVPSEIFYKNLRTSLSGEDFQKLQNDKKEEFEKQKLEKDEELKLKFEQLNISRKEHRGSTTLSSFFYKIPNSSRDFLKSYDTFQEYYNKADLQEIILEEFKKLTTTTHNDTKDDLNYSVYDHLKNKNYYVAPGMRFGGKFIAYPGDPLRYHSHLIVNSKDFYDEDIGMGNIVNGGRLATAVKKVWAIGGETKEKEVKFFSIEWSGFG